MPVTPPRSIALVLLGAALATACGDGPTGPAGGRILLTNAAADTIGYRAIDRETSNLFDLVPGPFPASYLGGRLVAPGRTAAVPTADIDSYRAGGDVRFFIFRVAGGQATLRGVLDAPAAAAARPGYRLRVTAAWLTPQAR